MRAEFPPDTAWSVSQLEDIRNWLPALSHLQPTRELTLLIFDIRQAGKLLVNFDASLVVDGEGPSSDNNNSLPLASHPSPPLVPSSSPVTRPRRATRGQVIAKKLSEDAPAENEPTEESEAPVICQPPSTIRVQRPSRSKKALEESDKVEASEFLIKVRSSFCFCYIFPYPIT